MYNEDLQPVSHLHEISLIVNSHFVSYIPGGFYFLKMCISCLKTRVNIRILEKISHRQVILQERPLAIIASMEWLFIFSCTQNIKSFNGDNTYILLNTEFLILCKFGRLSGTQKWLVRIIRTFVRHPKKHEKNNVPNRKGTAQDQRA